jgi:hypothetical protein
MVCTHLNIVWPQRARLMQSPEAAPQTFNFGWFGGFAAKSTKKPLGAASPPRTPPLEADVAAALPHIAQELCSWISSVY